MTGGAFERGKFLLQTGHARAYRPADFAIGRLRVLAQHKDLLLKEIIHPILSFPFNGQEVDED